MGEKWFDFFHQHHERILSSPRKYVKYVIYACILVEGLTNNAYERFISVCSLATKAGIFAYQFFGKLFYKLTPHILRVFFDEILKKAFYKCGGWKLLNKHILRQKYLKFFDKYSGNKSFRNNRKNQNKLARKVAQITKLPKYETSNIKQETVEHERYSESLTRKVMSTVRPSLLAGLGNCKFQLKQRISSQAKTCITYPVFEVPVIPTEKSKVNLELVQKSFGSSKKVIKNVEKQSEDSSCQKFPSNLAAKAKSSVSDLASDSSTLLDNELRVNVRLPQDKNVAADSKDYFKNKSSHLQVQARIKGRHENSNLSLSQSRSLNNVNIALRNLKSNIKDLVLIFNLLDPE
ncbi:hypothetical protein TNIN_31851 [Trichonephila inaurata madagascariensis]|uniref:Uncharacterized protein n=1 Tax=Trichonephila inaurata madagascariensis TaxID=2747483 RepID=A0A8X6KGP8_9ARAC|nr:hypothetical protein TNIN_31851 [Trichonephila inaurata madagascariensis]